ncbi:MAG: hypothetical protein K2I00_03960 [Ruminococcus sp.]|nr:hypothetical protein [Ruminococcus sp.]
MYVLYCSECRKKLLKYDNTRIRKYESPLKKCRKCHTEYIDPRCHELAVEGIPSDVFSISQYIFLIVFGALILWRGFYLLNRVQIGVPSETQWLMPAVIILFGIICTVGGIAEIISVKTGLKTKKYDRLYTESQERLKNPDYVNKLQNLGYEIRVKK